MRRSSRDWLGLCGGSGTIFNMVSPGEWSRHESAVKQIGGNCTRVDRPNTGELGAHEGAPRTVAITACTCSRSIRSVKTGRCNWQRPSETRFLERARQWLESQISMFGKWTTGNQEILIVVAGSAACKSRLKGGHRGPGSGDDLLAGGACQASLAAGSVRTLIKKSNCTQVDRPITRELGAPRGAPRTIAKNRARLVARQNPCNGS